MTAVIRQQLTALAGAIADLKERVRVAVAGELGRAVGEAVRQVVEAAVSGSADPRRAGATPAYRRPPPPDAGWDDDAGDGGGWDRPRDPWDDDADEGRYAPAWPETELPAGPPASAVTAAVAAGVSAARWWAARPGGRVAAAGVGLGVVVAGVLGGPAARAAVAVLAAAADLLSAADALAAAAARLAPL